MRKKRVSLNKALSCVIYAQCFGLTAGALFGNGFMTAWLKDLGLSGSFIVLILSLPSAISVLCGIPAAFWADSRGKKFVGNLGSIITALSLGIFALPAFFETPSPMVAVCVGIFMFSFGGALFGSSWFGLISPIIPKTYRGRFFGRLRISWQIVNIIISFIIMRMLALYPSPKTFGVTLLVVMAIVLFRSWPYRYIPERPDSGRDSRESFFKSTMNLLSCPVYRKFLQYTFIVTFLTGSLGTMGALLQKDALNFSNDTIVLMGNIMFIGNVIGFYIGGQVVDKLSSYTMFLWGHVLKAFIMLALPLHIVIESKQLLFGVVYFLFGLISAAAGIAGSSHLFAVMPGTQRSLGTTMSVVVNSFAITIAGFAISGITAVVDLYPLQVGATKFSIYDLILLALGGILLCTLPSLKLLRANKPVEYS